MFNPKTDRIKKLSQKYPKRIKELEKIFVGKTNVYIDYANVKPWANKLGWHVDPKRLKQFLSSFNTIKSRYFYYGTIQNDSKSKQFVKEIENMGYISKTKPVKVLKLSIDVSSISKTSPDILKNFIRKPLLSKFKIEIIEYLNNELAELNKQKIYYIEDLKCNFDVEIGRDMLIDYDKNNIETFILWSGDSDFEDPVKQLLDDGKKVVIFATARKVSSELGALRNDGLLIFDIQKIKNFICWKKEIDK
jgi:uncharacterized LabA/DUF88 family protein